MNLTFITRIIILATVFAIFTLGHDFFGRTLAAAWDIDNRTQFNAKFNWIALVLGISIFSTLIYYLRKNPKFWWIKVAYFALTILLMLFSVKNLLVVHSEIIHFPQYALLALLLYPIIRNLPETLFLTMVLGLLDECYQYFVLAPNKTAYLDFNDMWLNTLGAGLGTLLAGIIFPQFLKPKNSYLNIHGLISKGVISIITIFALFFFSDFMGYNQEIHPNATYFLFKEEPESFWTSSDFEVVYHIVRPAEGILAMTFYFWIFFPLEKYFKDRNS